MCIRDSSVTHQNDVANIEEFMDYRKEMINQSNLRNDIEIFAFDPESDGFGDGGIQITSSKILTPDGQPISWLVGGERVVLEINCRAVELVESPIVGFILKDRLGQTIFGDNTFIEYQHSSMKLATEQSLTARFHFRFPVLPTGDYSFSVAIAEGTQGKHIQRQWLHDALIIKIHASSVVFGIVGVPMQNIEMAIS